MWASAVPHDYIDANLLQQICFCTNTPCGIVTSVDTMYWKHCTVLITSPAGVMVQKVTVYDCIKYSYEDNDYTVTIARVTPIAMAM